MVMKWFTDTAKNDVNTLKSESLSIDGKEVIFFDFLTRDGFTLLDGPAL